MTKETRTFTNAILKWPGANLASGISSGEWAEPDPDKAIDQFRKYTKALIQCNVAPILLEHDPNFPDGCFVEDTTVLTDTTAIICRPGHPDRRGETAAVSPVLSRFRELEDIHGPGTVDGGDVLRIGDHYYIGLSQRTNRNGAGQLSNLLQAQGFSTTMVKVGDALHLKSEITWIGDNRVVATPACAALPPFSKYDIIEVSEAESYAANCLWVNGLLIISQGFPGLEKALRDRKIEFVALDMSEFRKLDGSLTCLSLLF